MFDEEPWRKAETILTMSEIEVYSLFSNEGFDEEIKRISTLKKRMHVMCAKGGSITDDLKDALAFLKENCYVLDWCMGSYDFRVLLDEDGLSAINWACAVSSGRYTYVGVDYSLLEHCPVNSLKDVEEFLRYTGLDEALSALSGAYNTGGEYAFKHRNQMLNIIQPIEYKDVMSKKKLRPLYDAYLSICNRINGNHVVPDDVKLLFDNENRGKYTYAWEAVLSMFGIPDKFFSIKHVAPGQWLHDFTPDQQFVDYITGVGTGIFNKPYEFFEEMKSLAWAIDNYLQGNEFAICKVTTDKWRGFKKTFRFPVNELLSKERLQVLVECGNKVMPLVQECVDSDCSTENEHMRRLSVLGLTCKNSAVYKVFRFITQEELPKCDTSSMLPS